MNNKGMAWKEDPSYIHIADPDPIAIREILDICRGGMDLIQFSSKCEKDAGYNWHGILKRFMNGTHKNPMLPSLVDAVLKNMSAGCGVTLITFLFSLTEGTRRR